MRKIPLFAFGVPALLLLLATVSAGDAADPHIGDLKLSEGEDHVLLSATLFATFDEEQRRAIRGGVPLSFSYRIRLTRKGSIIGERMVRDRELSHGLEYDPVRQLYLFTVQGRGREVIERTTRDEEEALRWLTTIENWRLYPYDKLDRDTRYRVRVMATLRSVELPSVLGYLFFFTTIFNRETPWVQLDFIY
jgi:hypothetical protein